MAPQSVAYAAVATAMAMSKIAFTFGRRIRPKLGARSVEVKASYPGQLGAQRAYLTFL